MNVAITSLNFSEKTVRTVFRNGEMWWVANDVCAILGIKNHRDAVSRLDSQDVGITDVLDSNNHRQKTNLVSESGLYGLIFQSRKTEAVAFQRWVTKEVLPSIRKHGFYLAQRTVETRFIATVRQLQDLNFLPHTALKIARDILKITDQDEEIGDMLRLVETLKAEGAGCDLAAKIARELPKRFEIFQHEKAQRLSGA